MSFYKTVGNDLVVYCHIKPNAHKNEILGVIDNKLKIALKTQPIEGQANKELIVFLSKTLKVPKTSISIESGTTSKFKTLKISSNVDWKLILK